MLNYTPAPTKDMPLYLGLYHSIREDILSGKLKADAKLPSKRSLAQHMKVSVITVENAYAQLLAEGYIRAEERRGYFVSEGAERPGAAALMKPEPVPEGKTPENCFVDLCSNRPDESRFPFSVWSKILRSELSGPRRRLLAATPAKGAPELRRAIADYLFACRGMSVQSEQIVVGAGAEYLYNLIVQLLGRERIYAVEDPGHVKAAKIYEKNAMPLRYVQVDEKGMRVDTLYESGADTAHISPSHHFPTGVVMPIGRRQEMLAWAEAGKERYIIEDDYDSEFRFAPRPLPTLQSIDISGRVIYTNTFSKSLAPSIRIGYMVLPPKLVERFSRELSFYACTVPSFEQYTLARFIAEGHFERHIGRMKKHYRAERDAVIGAIAESPLAGRAEILEQDAGLHFLLKVKTNKSDETLRREALSAGVRLAFLSEYSHIPVEAEMHQIVVDYSGVDRARLGEAFARLGAIL
ncbi:MAG: PLP-dependent aminotransferase family protein [Clostridiales bacterium]|nr:PLP-dependent aminotransferase family protein [Clostridiales bacterium]